MRYLPTLKQNYGEIRLRFGRRFFEEWSVRRRWSLDEATPFAVEDLEPALKKLGVEKEWSVKDNFMLLRAILTGKTASPPLLESLIVYGKARSLDRMRRFLETQKRLANTRK